MFYNKKNKELGARIAELEAQVAELKTRVLKLAENVEVFCRNVDALAESYAHIHPKEEETEEPCALADESKAKPASKKRRPKRKKNGEETPKATE